jgi:hypothetical protein
MRPVHRAPGSQDIHAQCIPHKNTAVALACHAHLRFYTQVLVNFRTGFHCTGITGYCESSSAWEVEVGGVWGGCLSSSEHKAWEMEEVGAEGRSMEDEDG